MRFSKDTDQLELLDFYADWCAPCLVVNPLLDALANKFADKVHLVKINVDVETALVEKFEVYSIPTLILVKNGVEIGRIVGAKDKDLYQTEILKSIK